MPRYDLYRKYNSGAMPMISSRGCPFDCSFCGRSYRGGRTFRAHSPERVVKEMQLLTGMGAKVISFFDDTFTIDKARVLRICELIRIALPSLARVRIIARTSILARGSRPAAGSPRRRQESGPNFPSECPSPGRTCWSGRSRSTTPLRGDLSIPSISNS